MTNSRRQVLRSLATVTAGMLLTPVNIKASSIGNAALGTKDESGFQIESLAHGVFLAKGSISYFENGKAKDIKCNNGWIVFDDFVLVIDANFPGNASDLLQEIKKRTSKQVKFVFNTHHHGDHIYGNRFWFEHGATPIAHVGVVNELKKYEKGHYESTSGRWEQMCSQRQDLRSSSLLPPILTFEDKTTLEDKHHYAELLHIGPGHTMGDGVVWLPREKIMFVGDACLNGPYNLFKDANIKSWINTLELMKHYDPRIIIGGHGEIGDGTTIGKQQSYLETIYQWVGEQYSRDKTWQDIKQQLPSLRTKIQNDPISSLYLIPEPVIVDGFSLESHARKIFEEISIQ